MVDLETKLDRVLGKDAARLEKAFGMETVRDLLNHLPRKYQERAESTDLGALVEGDYATIWARVVKVDTFTPRSRSRVQQITKVTVTDGHGFLDLSFFNARWAGHALKPGVSALFSGKVGSYQGKPQLASPEVHISVDEEDLEAVSGPFIVIYPATAKVKSWEVGRAVRHALKVLDLGNADDPVPLPVRRRRGLPSLTEAYALVHSPAHVGDWVRGRERLAWEEALVVQVILAQRRAAADRLPAVPRPVATMGILAEFDGQLPFELTAGQREVGDLLAIELAKDHPMHRLLQGEVGSGKTLVAARAMLQVVDAGGQAALLAPTEVLAQQHARGIAALLGPLGQAGQLGGADRATRVALVTGSLGAAQRRRALEEVASGEAGIVVGTHALLEPTVEWADLGLVVVDEQHRFGVEQRDALRQRGSGASPHVLVMTATPIPRTVAMTVFGDLETSTLTELPRGRQPISTAVVPADKASWMDRMWGRVREEVAEGRRAFVVCPRIAAGDAEPAEDAPNPGAAVEDVLPLLAEGELRGLRVAPLHGRLSADEKDATMQAFARGALDVLVATTVIEVGVDVPEATVMVVLDADRFGVSQLHQLRGRVGRGKDKGWCLLHTAAPPGTPARTRLDAVAATSDGAQLARLDLEQRREGDVLGSAQSGSRKTLRLLDLLRHEDVIHAARDEAEALVADDPALAQHPALAGAVADALRDADAAYLEKG